jgi:hypothetical protein
MTEKMITVSVIDAAIIDLLQQRDKNELKDQVWNQTQMLNAMINKLIEIKKEAI